MSRDRIDSDKQIKLDQPLVFGGHEFSVTGDSLTELTLALAALGAGVPLPKDYSWRTVDNQIIPLNESHVRALASSVLGSRFKIHADSWAAKDAVE